MSMGRLMRLPATTAALLALAAVAFAGGAEEDTQAADEAAGSAMAAGAGMAFDHEWDSLRTFVTVSQYTSQTGNAVGRVSTRRRSWRRGWRTARWSRSPTGCPTIPRW